jgi:hypothetical protein
LTILLSKNINKLRSTWGFGKDGTYQATLRKVVLEKWDNLFKSKIEVPSNFERWTEMENALAKEEKILSYDAKPSIEQDDEDNDKNNDDIQTKNKNGDKKRKKKAESEFVDFLDNSKYTIGGKRK